MWKKHMPEAWNVLSGMEKAFREQQLLCTEMNVHIYSMCILPEELITVVNCGCRIYRCVKKGLEKITGKKYIYDS